ncbi:MAG: hypothetical protein I8H91_02760 [Burkholderiales bacterium]|nr:hypothetical protein [Burkholderiales bacterium]
MTSITLLIPVGVAESIKDIAPKRGFAGYPGQLHLKKAQGRKSIHMISECF